MTCMIPKRLWPIFKSWHHFSFVRAKEKSDFFFFILVSIIFRFYFYAIFLIFCCTLQLFCNHVSSIHHPSAHLILTIEQQQQKSIWLNACVACFLCLQHSFCNSSPEWIKVRLYVCIYVCVYMCMSVFCCKHLLYCLFVWILNNGILKWFRL